jgi:hypothetical protein
MAELVRDGVDGLRFHVGDAGDLRRVLETVIERPAMLAEMRLQAPDVPTIESQVGRIRGHYERALASIRT